MDDALNDRLAEHLRHLRQERQWSLDILAERSGVSRATLSRIEKAEVSPTTEVLGRLCTAYTLSMSRLLARVEEGFAPVIRHADQPVWTDRQAGFRRRSVSPPATALNAEVLECELEPGMEISYDAPPLPGLEHHLLLHAGALTVTVEGQAHRLQPGDCLRYRLFGGSRFETPADQSARYTLFLAGS